jgi:hypothetical protein
MTAEPTSFLDCWHAVDAAMLKPFGIDTSHPGIDDALP